MLLLFPETLPGIVPERRSQETKAFIYGHSADIALAGLELQARKSGSFKDYERFMYDFWAEARKRGEGYMIVEQDVVPPSVAYLEEMSRCPELLCVAPVEDHEYSRFEAFRDPDRSWKCSAGTPNCRPGASASSRIDRARPHKGSRPTRADDDWANCSGTGIMKFSAKLCRLHLDLGNHYAGLDSRLYGWLQGQSRLWRDTHLHWGPGRGLIKHNHTFCNGDPENPDVPS